MFFRPNRWFADLRALDLSSRPRISPLSHRGEIAPKVLEALRAAEKGSEIGRVDQDDVARPLTVGRRPEQAIKLFVPRRRERMRTIGIDQLARQRPELILDRLTSIRNVADAGEN